LARRFLAAVEEGDLGGLEDLLAEDVVLHGDGGGKVPALARPVSGRPRVARTLLAWARAADRIGGATIQPALVNGQPGAISRDAEGRLLNVFALEVAGGRIQGISSVVNPDKLGHLGPVADYTEQLKRRR
jgi:RNA polymerase sigma-70 factor (ECF subfamily)